jgi:diaminohydroxyphosphoribosylaminopyrimidine deaminase/5-amino-6-(5-phosphoribosylamino)uracil reductase
MTLDGRIADRNGRSKWITGSASRTAVQALRRRADAIMVGVDTVLRDDPSLWPRPARGRRPLRIIVDTMGRSRLDAQVLSDRHAGQTVIATTRQCPPRRVDAFRRCGADVWVLPGKKQVSLKLLLKKAGQQGLLHILCEGGGLLAESLLQQQLVDRGEFFYAPKVAGDDRALSAFRGRGWLLPAMPRFAVMSVECLAPDVRVTVRPQGKPGTP